MWNSKKSVLLSLIFVYFFMVALAALEIFAPWVVEWFLGITNKSMNLQPILVTFVYTCLLPLAYALWLLRRLIGSIRRDICFSGENVSRLRRLSWCCFIMVPLCLVFGIHYFPILILTPFAAFMGLILRVVKNTFQTALELQTENEMTI